MSSNEGPSARSATDPLETEFGGPLPPGLANLAAEDAAQLVYEIGRARTHQAAALAEATELGLAIVPKILRGTVKKVLFG